jgi:hypothetical protein
MTAPTNTYLTTSAVGNREDLSDTIYRISPTQTPVFSMAAKAKATNTLHEWQTQDLAPPSAVNAQVEGDEATAAAATPTVRLTNRTQIMSKTASVSGSQEAMNSAGRKSEMGYQLALKALEIRRDAETNITQSDVLATSPRSFRGLRGWLVENVSRNAGTLASYTGNTGYIAGTLRTFAESHVKDVLQKIFIEGGEPDTIMLPPALKQAFSAFTGNSTRFDKGEDKRLTASVDVYVSDFGELSVIPNRLQAVRDVFVLQADKLAIAYLRPFMTTELAKTGDADRRQILAEFTLEMRAPKSCGAIYDVQ